MCSVLVCSTITTRTRPLSCGLIPARMTAAVRLQLNSTSMVWSITDQQVAGRDGLASPSDRPQDRTMEKALWTTLLCTAVACSSVASGPAGSGSPETRPSASARANGTSTAVTGERPAKPAGPTDVDFCGETYKAADTTSLDCEADEPIDLAPLAHLHQFVRLELSGRGRSTSAAST